MTTKPILDFRAYRAEASKRSTFPQYDAADIQGGAEELAEQAAQAAVAKASAEEGNRIAEMARSHPERFSPVVASLFAAVREWQEAYKALEAHLDTSPGSLQDEDLARWNESHEPLAERLWKAEEALAACQIPEDPATVARRELVDRIEALDPATMSGALERERKKVLGGKPLAPAGALPSGEDD